MTKLRTDVAILGAGFAGSLLALMLSKSRDVVLIERGRHPRFSLGESSTPLADFALEQIAREYDLPWLAALARYGSWKRTHPQLTCGLKRGFTFARHERGRAFVPQADHANELLVAASPDDESADTQWLRADFDHFILTKAVEAGVPYFDRTQIERFARGKTWRLAADGLEVEANFVVDATGAGGALASALALQPQQLRTHSYAVFSHFDDVSRWEDVVAEAGGSVGDYPFHADDAALHHVFDDGWLYVLRFDTGLVSAGFLLDGDAHPPRDDLTPHDDWHRLLSLYPSVAHQFCRARPVRPIERTRRLQRFFPECAGDDWALLAPAAYSMDALFSTGNGHALTTVRRLARILTHQRGREAEALHTSYAPALRKEVAFIDRLVSTAYRAMRSFPLFAAWTTYYFAGAISAEERAAAGRADADELFLSAHLPWFDAAIESASRAIFAGDVADFARRVAHDVAPINTTGLCDPAKRNMYPY